MQGNKNKFRDYLTLLLLGFVLFNFSLKFSLQEGKLAFAYNMNNLEHSILYEKLVQNPKGSQNAENNHNHIRIF
ncbi:MAG: hypothetical protein ACOX1X_09870 [Dethiobacteria bacterium]|jgi:hypothetical protein